MMKLTKLLALALTSVMLFTLLSACGTTTDDEGNEIPDGYAAIKSESEDYTLYAPDDWLTDTTTGVTSVYVQDEAKSSVNISVNSISSGFQLDEYWNTYKEEFENTFKNFKLTEEGEETKLGGEDARRYVYTGTVGGIAYKWLQVYALHGTDVYLFTYTSTPDDYEKNMEDISTMLQYFRFD